MSTTARFTPSPPPAASGGGASPGQLPAHAEAAPPATRASPRPSHTPPEGAAGTSDTGEAERLASQLWQWLEAIPDPEIPVLSIRELGILRAVQVPSDGIADVVITPTYSGCPAVEQIRQDIIDRLRAHGMQARVSVQLAPAWTTDWIDAAAREKLRAFGIAPPAATADARAEGPMQAVSAGYRVSLFGRGGTDAGVCCPRCGSANTRELAHFASTACKALYRCMACREPFDYFKPH